MVQRMDQIASVLSGIYAKPSMQGNAVYLQLRHFNESGQQDPLAKADLFVDEKMERHLLRDGDILFMAKGNRNVGVIYRNTSGKAVASSSFLVVRIRDQFRTSILPEYLAWFINHSRSQARIKSYAKGSGIPSVTLSGFSELEVWIPDVDTQRKILMIHELRTREKSLLANITALKDHYIQESLITITQHEG